MSFPICRLLESLLTLPLKMALDKINTNNSGLCYIRLFLHFLNISIYHVWNSNIFWWINRMNDYSLRKLIHCSKLCPRSKDCEQKGDALCSNLKRELFTEMKKREWITQFTTEQKEPGPLTGESTGPMSQGCAYKKMFSGQHTFERQPNCEIL